MIFSDKPRGLLQENMVLWKMDYTKLFAEIKKASLFDLFRISTVIYNEIDNPEKVKEIKRRLKPGMSISYYEPGENRLIDAVIIELRRTRLLVRNRENRKRWLIEYASVNLEGVSADISFSSAPEGLDRNQLRVGDIVGFYHNDEELHGEVVKLNPKKAKVLAPGPVTWSVPYSMLFRVIEGNTVADGKIIDVKVLKGN